MAKTSAAINYEQLSHITKKYYIPQLVDNIFKSNVDTYRLLAKSQPISGGYKVVQPVEFAKAPAKGLGEDTDPHINWYKGDDAMKYGASDIVSSAEYDWSQNHGTVSISGREENINSGPEAVLDLLQAKINNVGRTIRDQFALAMYSHNDPAAGSPTVDANAPVGLQHVCAVDRTLGGINSDTSGNEYWDGGMSKTAGSFANIDGSDTAGTAGTQLTFSALTNSATDCYVQTIFRDAYKTLSIGSDTPTMIICNQVVFDAYEATLTDQKRFGASSTTLADAGFQNLLYRGIPVVVDQALELYDSSTNANDGNRQMFFLNEKYMGYKHHSKRNFTWDGFEKPVDRDMRVGKILWMGALCFSSPRMLGKVEDMPTIY